MRILIILFFFGVVKISGQSKIPVDTTGITEYETFSKVPFYSKFCIEYLNYKMLPVNRQNAQFKRYTYYFKGQKSSKYPYESVLKKDKIFICNKEVRSKDSMALMNGLYTLIDKKGRVYEEIYYIDGFLVKHVLKDGNFWHPREKGKIVSEIAEFDYSVYPFKIHYIQFKRNKIIKNLYIRYINSKWVYEYADTGMSNDPQETKRF